MTDDNSPPNKELEGIGSKKKQTEQTEKLRKSRKPVDTDDAEKQPSKKNHAKEILDKYKPLIIRKDKVFLKDGVAQVNTHNPEKYTPEKYAEDIVLQIAPKDAIVIEFEAEPSRNKRYIAEMEESCRVQNIECCVSEHEGCKSPYLRIYNIKGMPVNYDNKVAKDLMIETLIPSGAKEQLDTTNIGWTLSPVIDHPHWKPKYKGAIHKIIRGISPLDQVNEYPREFLKKISKAKKQTKFHATEILRNNPWVNDFLVNYCTNNLLPKGSRHYIIEKNLAAIIYHRTDVKDVINRYRKAQDRHTNTLRTWFNAIANGNYNEVSVLEIRRYIKDNNIPYEIPATDVANAATEHAKPITAESKKLLKDPKLLFNLVEEIHKQGIIGEDSSIIVLINKTNLRLVKHHNPTSSNTVISDIPGAGKDVLVKIVTKVMVPKDKLIHRTRFSDKALEYFMTNKEEEYTLDGSVIYLEDPEDELLKSQAFRVMASGQSKVSVVKDQALMELEVKGKPVILVTSVNATIDEEGGRRWDGIKIDTSEILTIKVIEDKLRKNSEGIDWKDEAPPMAKAIQSLKPYEVIIPYAIELLPYFEKTPSLIMRTQTGKLLDYIKSSAVFHQYQRKKDSKGRLIADDFDYEYGKFMFQILGDAEGGILSPIERDLIEILKNSSSPLSFAEISASGFKRTVQWIYKHLEELKAKGVVNEKYEFDDGANKNIRKLYPTFGYSSMSLPAGLVLNGFKRSFENQQQGGFNGFNGFISILKELNKNRALMKLSKIDFEDLDEKNFQNSLNFVENHKNHKNLSVEPILKPNKNRLKPTLSNRIDELQEYCKKIKQQGNRISYENLCYNFDTAFIEKCKEQKILIPLPDASYDIVGVSKPNIASDAGDGDHEEGIDDSFKNGDPK